MTKKEADARFYAECDEALRKRNAILENAEASIAQADREIVSAYHQFDEICREALHRRDVAIAAPPKVTP